MTEVSAADVWLVLTQFAELCAVSIFVVVLGVSGIEAARRWLRRG